MNTMIRTPLLGLLLLGAAGARATPVLTLVTPDLTGAAGQTVGWDFVLANTATGLDLYVSSVYAGGTLYGSGGTSALGLFTDAVSDWSQAGGGLVVADNDSFTGSFPTNPLASFAIDPIAAAVGNSVSGAIYLTYDLCDAQLNCQSGLTLTAQYEGQDALATVSVVATPVPATAALLALGLAGLAGRAKRGA